MPEVISAPVDQPNSTQITFPNNSVTPLQLEDQENRTVKYGIDVLYGRTETDRETDRTETVVRDQDFVRDSVAELLTEADREKLRDCICALQDELCGVMFQTKQELIDQADKIFDLACTMESRLRDEIEAQIEDIKCQFYRDITKQFDLRARIAGSSRNTFVIQEQNEAHCDMLRKLAALQAELHTAAIKDAQNALNNAFQNVATARIEGLNAAYQMLAGLWSVLRGALQTGNETGHTDDDSTATMAEVMDQDVTQIRGNFNWVRQVSQTQAFAGIYDPDYADNDASQPALPFFPFIFP